MDLEWRFGASWRHVLVISQDLLPIWRICMIENDRMRYAGYEGMGFTPKDKDIEIREPNSNTTSVFDITEHI